MLFTLSAPDTYPRRAAYAVRFAAAMQAKLPTVAATVTSRIGAIVCDWLRTKLSSSPSPNRDTRPNDRARPGACSPPLPGVLQCPSKRFRVIALLSYAHADASWATWLHRQIEGYRIDPDLVGRITPRGPIPDTLRPVFRDRDDFTGGRTLSEATVAALDRFAALIVLCSSVSATRPAVNEEIRLFRARHPDRTVIPVMIDRKYPDNFPAA